MTLTAWVSQKGLLAAETLLIPQSIKTCHYQAQLIEKRRFEKIKPISCFRSDQRSWKKRKIRRIGYRLA